MEFIREDCIYARQSVDRKDSISIESQIDFCKYELKGGSCRVFKDKGYSGKNTDRPEFQKLLGEIRKGKVRRVIVYDKMARAGFHVTKSEVVDAPVIDELPMTLECKLISFDEESELLLGEIVNVSADERILDSEGKIDPQKLRPITFDPVHNDYLVLGEKVGNAFEDGKKLK